MAGTVYQSFVYDGLSVTKDSSTPNQINVTGGHIYFQNKPDEYEWFAPQSFNTLIPNATYYLNAYTEGVLLLSTINTAKAGYLNLATITTDAYGNVLTITTNYLAQDRSTIPGDVFGGDELSRSIATRAKLKIFDVRDYGAVGDGVTDDTTAIQAAVNAANSAGGGKVFIPDIHKITSRLRWYTNISLLGRGPGRSILKPYGTGYAVIQADATLGSSTTNTLNDCVFAEFEIDCSNLGDATKVYSIAEKGFYIQYMIRARFIHVYVHDAPATGFGVDFLQDSSFIACKAYNNGRLCGINGGSSAGGSGFGIGTGQWQVENTSIIGCDAQNNGQSGALTSSAIGGHGIFFERQSTAPSYVVKGVRVIGCTASYNYTSGICDKGCDGMRVIGCTMRNNSQYGFYALDTPQNGLVDDCTISDNSSYGMYFNNTGPGYFTVSNNKIYNNTVGVEIVPASTHVFNNVVLKNNEIFTNSKYGVYLNNTSGGSLLDPTIENNLIYNNGTGGSSTINGIQINMPLTNPRIVNNKIFDNQGTKTQGYGIAINSGITITGGRITHNDLQNNKTGAFSNAGTLSNTVVDKNPGYNTGSTVTTLTPSASPWTYTAGSSSEVLTVTGSGLSLAINGTTVLSGASNIIYPLQPYQAAVVTYTTATNAYSVK